MLCADIQWAKLANYTFCLAASSHLQNNFFFWFLNGIFSLEKSSRHYRRAHSGNLIWILINSTLFLSRSWSKTIWNGGLSELSKVEESCRMFECVWKIGRAEDTRPGPGLQDRFKDERIFTEWSSLNSIWYSENCGREFPAGKRELCCSKLSCLKFKERNLERKIHF